MNVAGPQTRFVRGVYKVYVALFYIYLTAPLVATGVFAFNDSLFPTMPWKGFTWSWFFGDKYPKIGFFHDSRLLSGLETSLIIGLIVAFFSVLLGTCNAFLFERKDFKGKEFLYGVLIVPLVIPGVIIGISLLVISNLLANGLETSVGLHLSFLRPGVFMVCAGQISFITTITSLVIAARLRKFDVAMEEAALNLGARRLRVLRTITLPYLRPGILAAAILAFLMSFENFNTTVMLVGFRAPLTIAMYNRMMKVGSTPTLNAVSFLLMIGSGILALISVLAQREKKPVTGDGDVGVHEY